MFRQRGGKILGDVRAPSVSGQFIVVATGLVLIASSSCTPERSPAGVTFTARDADVVAMATIPDSEPRSLGTYRVQVTWADGGKDTMRTERDGMVDSIWVADLDGDGTPEVVVATKAAGSGAFGDVHVYHRAGGALARLAMPPLGDDAAPGYMGHDAFTIREGRLYRTYPVYREGDSNAEPTGGDAVFWYSVAESAWVRQLDGSTAPQ